MKKLANILSVLFLEANVFLSHRFYTSSPRHVGLSAGLIILATYRTRNSARPPLVSYLLAYSLDISPCGFSPCSWFSSYFRCSKSGWPIIPQALVQSLTMTMFACGRTNFIASCKKTLLAGLLRYAWVDWEANLPDTRHHMLVIILFNRRPQSQLKLERMHKIC